LAENFYYYNQTLTFSQRNIIINKLLNTKEGKIIEKKIGLNNKSFLEKYFELLYEMKKFKDDNNLEKYEILENLFKTKYYVDNNSIKIPLIYGTTELRYSGLINNLYQNLFFNIHDSTEENNTNEKENPNESSGDNSGKDSKSSKGSTGEKNKKKKNI
jgi:hypothetical protein